MRYRSSLALRAVAPYGRKLCRRDAQKWDEAARALLEARLKASDDVEPSLEAHPMRMHRVQWGLEASHAGLHDVRRSLEAHNSVF